MSFKQKFYARYFVGFLFAYFVLAAPIKFVLGKHTLGLDFICNHATESILIALAMSLYVLLFYPIITKQITLEILKDYKLFNNNISNLKTGEYFIIENHGIMGDIKLLKSSDNIFIIECSKYYLKQLKLV